MHEQDGIDVPIEMLLTQYTYLFSYKFNGYISFGSYIRFDIYIGSTREICILYVCK